MKYPHVKPKSDPPEACDAPLYHIPYIGLWICAKRCGFEITDQQRANDPDPLQTLADLGEAVKDEDPEGGGSIRG